MTQVIDLYGQQQQAMANALQLLQQRQRYNEQVRQWQQEQAMAQEKYNAQVQQWGAENDLNAQKRDLDAAKGFIEQTKGLYPEQRDKAAQDFIRQNPGAARYIAQGMPMTDEEQYRHDVWHPPQQQPAPAPNAQQGGAPNAPAPAQQGVGNILKADIQKAVLALGPEGAKLLVDSNAAAISNLPPNEQMNALRITLNTAVDAKTKYSSDTQKAIAMANDATQRYVAQVSGWTQGVDPSTGNTTFVNPRMPNKNGLPSTMQTDVKSPAVFNARSKPATQFQQRALGFYMRGKDASDTIMQKGPKGEPSLEDKIASYGTLAQGRLQYAPNIAQSPEMQMYRQAQRAFTEARLRKDSGAAVPPHEYENDARTYFAQVGDSAEVLAQKRAARQTILNALKQESGPAFDQYYNGTGAVMGGAQIVLDPTTGEPINQ